MKRIVLTLSAFIALNGIAFADGNAFNSIKYSK